MATSPDSLPTLADVGRMAGVSASAASLALRNDPRITAPTKARVLEAARKLGYVPDPILSALVARRSRRQTPHTLSNLAALFDDTWGKRQPNDWLTPLFDGLDNACRKLGYHLDILNIQRDLLTSSRPDQILLQRGIRGLILLPLHQIGLNLPLDWKNYSVTSIGSAPNSVSFHHTGPGLFQAVTTACNHVYELGYRRLGLAHSRSFEERTQFQWLGSLCKEVYLKPALKVVPPYLPPEQARASFLTWFKKHKPDCILSNSPSDLQLFLEEEGYRIPKDVGIVALSRNTPLYHHYSGVAQHLDLAAEAAVRHVHQLILTGETGVPEAPRQILVASHWFDGDTTRKITAARK